MAEKVGSIYFDLDLDDSKFKKGVDSAGTSAKNLASKLDSDVKAATDRTQDRFNALGGFISKSLVVAGVAAAAAGVASIKMAGDFEQSLNVLKSVSGATADEMAKLSAKARQLGQDASLPGVSAADAAQAMTELAKAGVGVNDILSASKGVLSLAKAGNLEVADAATIAARALNSFGLSGDKASQVADTLAAGANASSADVDELALALSQAGAGASRMGLSLGDTVTTLGLFSNAGVNGSDAGTSLKTMLMRLVPQTDAAAQAMKDLGLDFFDANGNFVGMKNTAAQLQKALGGLTQEQREAALTTIFGSDASRAASIIATQGAAGFDKMAAAVNKQGAATDLAAAQNSGFKGAMDNLISTLETIGTDLGTKLLPPLTEFLKVLAEKLPPVVDWIIKNGKVLAIVIATLGATFAAVRVAGFVSDLMKAQKTLALFVGAKNAAGILALGNAFKAVGTTIVAVLRTVGAAIMANPIGLIITIIAAVIAALVFLQLKFNIFGKLFEALKPVFETVGDALAKVGDVFKKVFGFIGKVVGTVIDFVVGYIKWYIGVWLAVFQAAWAVIQWVFAGIMAIWNTVLKPVFDAIIYIVTAIGTIFYTIFSGIFTVVWTIISTLAQIIGVIFLGIYNFIVNTILTPIKNFFVTVFTAIWNTVSTIFNAVWNFIKTVATAIWNTIVTIFTAVWNFYVAIFTKIYNFVSGIFQAVWNFISKVVSAIWNTISGVFTGIYNTIAGAVSRMWNAITGTFNNIKNAISNAVKAAWDAVTGWFGRMVDAGKNLIDGIVKGVMNAKDAVVNKIKDICKGALDAVKNFFGIHSPSTLMADMGEFLMAGMKNGIQDAGGAAIAMAKAVSSKIADGVNGGIAAVADGSSKITGLYGNMYGNLNNMALANAGALNSAVGAMSAAQEVNVNNGGSIAQAPINVTVAPQGIVARSRSELRDIAGDMIEAVNEDLRSRGYNEIGDGNVRGTSTNG